MTLVSVGDNVTDCYVDLGCMFPGGNSVNVAVAAARAGTPAAFIGVVGDDARGRQLTEALDAEGLDTSGVRTVPGRTAYAVVRHVAGERVFGPNDKGVSLFRPTVSDLAPVARFGVAHTSYCSGLEPELPGLASRTRVSFDFNDRTDGEYADMLLPHLWVATFSASHLTRSECAELLRWANARGPRYVFATRGRDGAMAYDGTWVHEAPAAPVVVVDSLGAGDAFIGRALHGLLVGESVPALLASAVRAGSQACTELGAFGHGRRLALPASAELERFHA